MSDLYDPLEYSNLTRHLVRELMDQKETSLPIKESFAGPGVYALFYNGDFEPYVQWDQVSLEQPIYVGKAVPPGSRKGGVSKSINPKDQPLFKRLAEHSKSIDSAKNLSTGQFLCRYLTVVPLWITAAERFLIEHYRPLWNVCIEGFGNHNPGSGRHQGEISWWDALHPGRPWAAKLRRTRSQEQAITRLDSYFQENLNS